MALDVTPGSVSPVEIYQQFSAPAAAALVAGQAVMYDPALPSWVRPSAGGTVHGITIGAGTIAAGMAGTFVRKGLIDLGGTALGATNAGVAVYAAMGTAVGTAGGLETVASGATAVAKVGIVVPAYGSNNGGTLSTDRLLRVDL